MKNLLNKEIKLVMHPTNLIFLALSAMMLIPNYPYYVTFFYTCLGVFFLCLNGRENHDIAYTMSLPVRKRDIVKARFLLVGMIELAQVAAAALFAGLRRVLDMPGNMAGMDANLAFFGLAFGMLGLFNWVFFRAYYKAPDKVGSAFVLGSAAVAVYMLAAEAGVYLIPFMKDQLDTPDPAHLFAKGIVLAVGVALFAGMTLAAYRKSAARFEALDL